MQTLNYQELITALLADGILSETLTKGNETEHPIARLAEMGCRTPDGEEINEDWLTSWLAKRVKQKCIRLHDLTPPVRCTLFTPEFLRTHAILPLSLTNNCYEIAHLDPFKLDWKFLIEHFHAIKVIPMLTAPTDLWRLFDYVYAMDSLVVEASIEQHSIKNALDFTTNETNEEEGNISAISDRILHLSARNQASDIHIEPQNNSVCVRIRIDGILHTVRHLPTPVAIALCNRLKILADMDIAEQRKAQDGRFEFTCDNVKFDARVATIPVFAGEKLVIRLLDNRIIKSNFSSLGMSADLQAIWQKVITLTSGLILSVGPTGCGKSTTLYTSLQKIGSKDKSIATIEDPIEYVVPHFSQTQVKESLGFGYADGLKAMLRQDPDVIMIGEIRDQETAKIAIQAALTGHLIFASMHASDCAGAEERLLELGVSETLLRQTLVALLSQRLVRKFCNSCDGNNPQCDKCRGTGYHGRIALFQYTDKRHLNNNPPPTFYDLGKNLIAQSLTDEQEIDRVCGGI